MKCMYVAGMLGCKVTEDIYSRTLLYSFEVTDLSIFLHYIPVRAVITYLAFWGDHFQFTPPMTQTSRLAYELGAHRVTYNF